MSLGSVFSTDTPNYSLKDLSSASGIFYEKISEVHYYDQSWRLITYLNTSYISYRQEVVSHYVQKIEKICEIQKDTYACHKLFPTLQHKVPIIQNSYENLLSLISHKESKSRTKRGLINFIGSGLKALFGTMDDNDAEYIKNAIQNLEENQKDSLTILQDQTTILSNTVNNFNDSIASLRKTEFQINKVIKEINQMGKSMANEINQTVIELHTTQMIEYFNILVIDTEIDLNKLINTVMFTKTGHIHPLVVPIKVFLAKLLESQESLPSGMLYPVVLREENMHLILQISDITSYFKNDVLVFVIKVPITNQDIFELYNMIPIPQKGNLLASTVMINPKKKYLIISKDKNKYTVTENINKDCKNLGKEKICRIVPFTNPFTNGICETELFIAHKMLNCDIRTIKNDNEIWNRLETQNTWLYTITRPTTLSMNCGKSEDIQLSGTGTLTIKNKNCKASTIYHTFIPDLELISHYENKIVAKDLANDDCCEKETLNYVNELHPVESIKITNVNLKELSETAHKLDISKGRISEILSRPNPTHHFSVLTYTVAGIIILILAFIGYKCSNGGKICFKLCCFNKWFCKGSTSTMPIVAYTAPRQGPRRRQIEDPNSFTDVKTRDKDPDYRYDL